uniref:HTH CENPB-type domain-containing protein n=1 Tax=Globodera rostochiensis TaxID=31243 RepID=A0A914HAP0_GLORO
MNSGDDSTTSSEKLVCCYCNNPTSGAHNCLKCSKPCHAIEPCSFSNAEEEGYRAKVICCDCWLADDIDENANIDNSTPTSSQKSGARETSEATDNNDEPTIPQSLKRRQLTIKNKLDILEFAKKSSIHAASRQHNIGRNNIREWIKNEKSLRKSLDSAKRKRLIGGGRKLANADFDETLTDWVRDLRAKKLRVTRNMIVAQAQQIRGNYEKLDNFSASHGWLERFMTRHNFSLRRPTTVAQKPPEAYTDAIINFIIYVQKLWHEKNFTYVYACDETAVWLDPSGGTCVAEKGSKTVTVLNTGHEKARVTVMLTARSDGLKLHPFVLLPKKRPVPDIIKRFNKTLALSWCGRTWMDNELTTKYLEEVFGKCFFGSRLLIWDSFRCHISEATKQTLRRLAIHSAVVPGGTTKYIQAPDVCWNAPFKNTINEQYNEWMVHGDKPTTPAGNLRAPPMETYLEWISTAWDSISKELIAESFLACGMTKEIDGQHDKQIHVFKPHGAIPNGLAILQQRREEAAVLRGVEEIDLGEDDQSDVSIDTTLNDDHQHVDC